MNTPILETERLILRRFTEREMEALYLILKDGEANRFLLWYPLKSLEETIKFYEERYVSKYEHAQGYAYAICLKEDDFPIGYINVSMEESHDFVYRKYWNRYGNHFVENL